MSIDSYRRRGIYLLPNLFTICALFSGFFAIVSALKGNFDGSAKAIFFAMVLDALDGRIARLTNTVTNFGAVFDSLSDMVAFGVAPSFLAFAWGLSSLGKLGWSAAFLYLAGVALRLARFNTQVEHTGKKYFQGLPCPAGAAIVTSLIWIYCDYELAKGWPIWVLGIIMFAISFFMVSNIRYYSFKEIELKGHVRFVALLLAVLVVALIAIDPEKVLFIVFFSYGLSGPFGTFLALRRKKHLRYKTLAQHEHRIDRKPD